MGLIVQLRQSHEKQGSRLNFEARWDGTTTMVK